MTLGLWVAVLTVVSVYGVSPATVHFRNLAGDAVPSNEENTDKTEVDLEQVGSLCFERISDIGK